MCQNEYAIMTMKCFIHESCLDNGNGNGNVKKNKIKYKKE